MAHQVFRENPRIVEHGFMYVDCGHSVISRYLFSRFIQSVKRESACIGNIHKTSGKRGGGNYFVAAYEAGYDFVVNVHGTYDNLSKLFELVENKNSVKKVHIMLAND